jgi:hypothetical protein
MLGVNLSLADNTLLEPYTRRLLPIFARHSAIWLKFEARKTFSAWSRMWVERHVRTWPSSVFSSAELKRFGVPRRPTDFSTAKAHK